MKKEIFCSVFFRVAFILLGLFFLPSSDTLAQVADTAFWFAAPYQTMFDGGGRFIDRPILFRIITGNQTANVTISQPANGGMPPLSLTVPANSTEAVNVSQWLNVIQNDPPDTVLDYGVKITSDVPVAAYYQIISDSLYSGGINPPNERGNPETFSLKGAEALGEHFLIPFQNEYYNDTLSAWINRRSSFVLVASENNTQVTIIPSEDIVDHSAGVPFSINLNAGQSYSATSMYASAGSHPIASVVTSDKPVAITVYDDFLRFVSGGSDNAGEQIVPNELLGTEYIALNGLTSQFTTPSSYGDHGDELYITATDNNTNLSINGSPAATLNSGQTYHMNMSNEDAAYVNASQPVTIWQLSGVSTQVGATQVPKLNCAGSMEMSYVRTLEGPILFNVVVPSGGENGFTINGNANMLTGAMFSSVPGTNGNWLYCRLNLHDSNAVAYPVDSIIKISNSASSFQLSVVEGSSLPNFNVWGATVGYFTDYGGINVGNGDTDILGTDTIICPGNPLTLDATASGASGYIWSTGATTSSITIDSAGTYWVHINGNFCGLNDTIHIISKPSINSLGPDTSLCPGSFITLDAATNGATGYLWNTGDTTGTIVVNMPGIYWVHAAGNLCIADDTVQISLKPSINGLGTDTVICPGNSLILNATTNGSTGYLWSTGDVTATILVDTPGIYWVHVDGDFCLQDDTIQITSKLSINGLGPDTSLCPGNSMTLDATTNGATGYLWSTGATTATISVNIPGTYWVHVDGDLCVQDDTVQVTERQIPPIDLGNDTIICAGQKIVLSAAVSSDGHVQWNTGATSASIIVQDSGNYWVTVSYPACGDVSDTIAIGLMQCDCFVGVPNVFSPNGDGRNDVFLPVIGPGCAMQYYDLRIYNRYGQLVFESRDPDIGWDGKQTGKKADLGVYMYYMLYKQGLNDTKVVRKGDLTLIR